MDVTEYTDIATGTFALANVPVMCASTTKLYSSYGKASVLCTLVGCNLDRKSRSDRFNACCTFTFDKHRLAIQWDHIAQLRCLFNRWVDGASLASCIQGVPTILIVELANPTSLIKAAEFVRMSSLFHVRLGRDMTKNIRAHGDNWNSHAKTLPNKWLSITGM